MPRHRLIPAFMVNVNSLPEIGHVQIIVRLAQGDANNINRAAEALRMRQSEFVRVALVRVAEQVLPMVYGSQGGPAKPEGGPNAGNSQD